MRPARRRPPSRANMRFQRRRSTIGKPSSVGWTRMISSLADEGSASCTSLRGMYPTTVTKFISSAILSWAKGDRVEWRYIASGKPMQSGRINRRDSTRRWMKIRRQVTRAARRRDQDARVSESLDRLRRPFGPVRSVTLRCMRGRTPSLSHCRMWRTAVSGTNSR